MRHTFFLAFLSVVILAGCGGGGSSGGGGGSPALPEVTQACSLQGQSLPCTNPGAQTVTTTTPNVAVTFAEAMNRDSVQRFVEVIVENLTDAVTIKDTVNGLVSGNLVAIDWSQDSTRLTVQVLKVDRQLENGKSYRVTASVGGGCAQTASGKQVCQGTLGPFIFNVRVS